MTSQLKKTLLSFAVILSFGSYAIWSSAAQGQAASIAATNPVTDIVPTPTPTPVATPSPSADTKPSPAAKSVPTPTPTPPPTPIPTPNPTPVATGRYRDGSYIGSEADAIYGIIQVKAIIKGGKITDVVFLKYPNDRGTSIEINQQAMPYLIQEAIAAQSAKIDGVTGATDSAAAFQESLTAALTKAS